MLKKAIKKATIARCLQDIQQCSMLEKKYKVYIGEGRIYQVTTPTIGEVQKVSFRSTMTGSAMTLGQLERILKKFPEQLVVIHPHVDTYYTSLILSPQSQKVELHFC